MSKQTTTLDKANITAICDLNTTQKGMLFHYLSDEDSNLYNVQLAIDITGELNTEFFEKSLQKVQAQNDVLKSVFRWKEISKPLQIILKQCKLDYRFINIENLHKTNKDQLLEILENDRLKRFDLEETPFRVTLIKTEAQKFTLVITHHHILYDGWSTGILLSELFSTYYDFSNSGEVAKKEKISLRVVQHQLKAIGKKDNLSVDFWNDYLEDYNFKCFELLSNNSPEYGDKPFKIEASTDIKALETFSAKLKVTPASVIYAAYGITLQNYLNTNDVVFGTPVSNRNTRIKGSDTVMGNFVNTLPYRFKAGGTDKVETLIKKCHNGLLERNEYAENSLYDIKKALSLKHSDALFDSLLVVENYPLDVKAINKNSGFKLALRSVAEHADLPFVITVFLEEELKVEVTCKPVFTKEFANSFANQFFHIINELVTSPDKLVSKLKLVPETTVAKLNSFTASGEKVKPEGNSVVEQFELQVLKTPKAIALVINNERLSYADLNRLADAVALQIQENPNYKKNPKVALLFDSSVEMIAAILGTLKTGGAYIPLQHDSAIERNKFILQDANADLLLTSENIDFTQLVSQAEIDTESIIQLNAEKLKNQSNNYKKPVFDQEDLAYIIYTSGTTGKPKGVEVPNCGLLNFVNWRKECYEMGSSDATLQLFSYQFDGYAANLYPTLLSGGTLVVVDKKELFDLHTLLEKIAKEKITNSVMTPSLFETILREIDDDSAFESLRYIVLAGEKAGKNMLKSCTEKLPKVTLYNEYGPTETSVGALYNKGLNQSNNMVLGKPIYNTQVFVFDKYLQMAPEGAIGEICIAGMGVAKGYVNREELTAQKFIANPYNTAQTLYRTGDLGRWLPDGKLEFLGRIDDQVKIRGYRVELGEIENKISEVQGIEEACVLVKNDTLLAYYASAEILSKPFIIDYLKNKLPDYMIPSYFEWLPELPLTPNGKIDKKALPNPIEKTETKVTGVSIGELENEILEIFSDILKKDTIDLDQNFFDIGGDSLKLITLSARISKKFNKKISVTDLFKYTTIRSLAAYIEGNQFDADNTKNKISNNKSHIKSGSGSNDIAVIGMAGRFPKASDVGEFWNNLVKGKDCISREENQDDNLIKAKGLLEDTDVFDGGFFDYIPSEVEVMDPQMRIFHECAWHALEDSGIDPLTTDLEIGIYGGASPNPYFNLKLNSGEGSAWVDKWQALTYADKDFLTTRVSYKLNLRGPSLNISTACSTSLVAIVTACDEILAGKCDVALAGGVSISWHDNDGYTYNEDMILSPDGTCRAFDAKASGTVSGNGAGIVVLKKLDKALEDGDNIHAVIKGAAMNNDGNRKVGFTAPSVEGQYKVIDEALTKAKVSPDTIGYIEAHGTATTLGDPIEIAALEKALSVQDKKQFCAIGSVKTNVGHLDAAAGVTGFIKAVLSIKNQTLVPSIHYTSHNPAIDFANSPFYVNNTLQPWNNNGNPLRAGVSSFGIGGTNAHIVLEQAPKPQETNDVRPQKLILVSGKTENSYFGNLKSLQKFLKNNPEAHLENIAYTLQTGRAYHSFRGSFVASTPEDLINSLENAIKDEETNYLENTGSRQRVAFMFSGQGSQYPGMCAELYKTEKDFQLIVDQCLEKIKQLTGMDLKPVIFGEKPDNTELDEIAITLPALFVIEYAMASMLMKWGIRPDVMIGYSFGEYVAACISEVFEFEDALKLVLKRAALLQKAPAGAMLSVVISEQKLMPLIEDNHEISVAGVNSSERCVISGTLDAIAEMEVYFTKSTIDCKRLRTAHAYHSFMLDGLLEEFENEVKKVTIKQPKIPYVSNVTGKLVDPSEVVKPSYWVNHLRGTVKFSNGIEEILKKGNTLFIEVGPGHVLTSFVRLNKNLGAGDFAVNMIKHHNSEDDDAKFFLNALGELWEKGLVPDWNEFYQHIPHTKVSLPGYAFEKTKYTSKIENSDPVSTKQKSEISNSFHQWFHIPSWKTGAPLLKITEQNNSSKVLVFANGHGLFEKLDTVFAAYQDEVIWVKSGQSLETAENGNYILDAEQPQHFEGLTDALERRGFYPDHIVYALELGKDTKGFGLWNFINSLRSKDKFRSGRLTVVTEEVLEVTGQEKNCGSNILIQNIYHLLSQLKDFIEIQYIDIEHKEISDKEAFDIYRQLKGKSVKQQVSFRNGKRWLAIKEKTDYEALTKEPLTKVVDDKKLMLLMGAEGVNYPMFHEKPMFSDERIYFLNIAQTDKEHVENFDYLHYAHLKEFDTLETSISSIEKKHGSVNRVIFDLDGIWDTASGDLEVRLREVETKCDHFIKVFEKREISMGWLIISAYPENKGLSDELNVILGNYAIDYLSRSNLFSTQNWTISRIDKSVIQAIANQGKISNLLSKILVYRQLISDLEQMFVLPVEEERRNAILKLKKSSEAANVVKASKPESLEDEILEIWKEFFGRSNLRYTDDFFKMGGDSLRAIKLLARMNAKTGAALTVKELFANPTVRKVSALITNNNEPGELTEVGNDFLTTENTEYFPLSAVQKRLFFLYELDRESLAYNVPTVLEIKGKLEPVRLKKAFNALLNRHQSLRTQFFMKDNKPLQKVVSDYSFEIEFIPENIDDQKAFDQFIKPFDLEDELPIRVGLKPKNNNTHLLFLDIHHLVIDGVSQGILINDFVNYYNNQLPDKKAIQYADFVNWENSRSYEVEKKKQKEYWINQFKETAQVPELPTDFTRPVTKSYKAGKVSFTIEGDKAAKLRNLASEQGVTLYMIFLSAYTVLLNKLSGEENVVIGTPVAGREEARFESVVGMFVNTLPMKNQVLSNDRYTSFLKSLQQRTLLNFENQKYKLDELVDDLGLERTLSRNPLFDCMFLYRNFDKYKLNAGDLAIKEYETGEPSAMFDLSLTGIEFDNSFELFFEYAKDLFKKETIERFANYFINILNSILDNPQKQISEIQILPESELNTLIHDFNRYTHSFDYHNIYELFKLQAEKTPTATAVIDGDVEISFKALENQVNERAGQLQQKGVRENEVVAVMLERSVDYIVAVLSVMANAAVFVPVSPGFPDERINYILNDSNARMLLSKQNLIDLKNIDFKGECVLIDSGAYVEDTFETVELCNNGALYVIYTSGTTGEPKGVLNTHEGLLNRLNWGYNEYPYSKTEICIQKTSIGFVDHIAEVFGPLLKGVPQVIAKDDEVSSFEGLVTLIDRYGIERITLVPSLLQSLLSIKERNTNSMKSLKYIFCSGDTLTIHLANQFQQIFEGVKLVNIYGSSEVSADATAFEITSGTVGKNEQQPVQVSKSSVSIGKPIPNMAVYILDKDNNPVPQGVVGEICVSGIGVAKEYLNKPNLTSEKIVANPFEEGKRMFKTGDTGSWNPDGTISYSGRNDNQVKIRGYRIEPGEIAYHLEVHPSVKECVVIPKEYAGDIHLVAYFVALKPISNRILRAYLLERVPDYMVPSFFEELKALPLNSNGKLDRKKLPELTVKLQTNIVKATTRTEEEILTIWEELLGVSQDKIGVDQSFFEMGGHSIKALQLAHMICDKFEVQLKLKTIFDHPTVKALSEQISLMKGERISPVKRVEAKEYYRVSSAQERIFYKQTLERESTAFNISGAFILENEPDYKKYEAAFTALIEKHETLRTTFSITENYVIQKINEIPEFKVERLREEGDNNVKSAFEKFIRPFNLSEDCLLRAAIFESKKQNVLFIDLHHIAADGFSLNILLNDFKAILEGKESKSMALRYVDYAEWQKKETRDTEILKLFWGEVLGKPVTRLELPVSGDRMAEDVFTAATKILKVNGKGYKKLKALANACGCSDFMVLLSAYYILLHKLTGNEDIIVGTDVLGRNDAALKNMVGTFINILPLRIAIDPDASINDFIKKVRDMVITSVDHQDYQFDQMVSEFWVQDEPDRNPIFDVHFSFANTFEQQGKFDNLNFKPVDWGESAVTEYEFKLEVREPQANEWDIAFIYSNSLYEDEIMEMLMSYYSNILKYMMSSGSTSIENIEIEEDILQIS